MKAVFLALLCLICGVGWADETVSFCYNWGCLQEAEALYSESVLREVGELLRDAETPAHERELLAVALGRMYGWAAERLPIGGDRAGNFEDFDVDGRMDCIDHSTNTTRLLDLFERRGWLRFHGLRSPEERHRFFIFPHRSAVVQEVRSGGAADGGESGGAYFAVDSWYVDPGKPVIVMPLEEWMSGAGPDVD